MQDFSGSGAGDGGDDDVVFDNLVPALLQTCALVMLGYVAKRNHWVGPEAGTVLGGFAAAFSLPALCFISMVQLDIGSAAIGLPLSMLAAKISVAALIALLTLYLMPSTEPRKASLSALFAMVTVSSNDFALGLPIIDALYPENIVSTGAAQKSVGSDDGSEIRMRDYVWLFAPITLLIINPISFAILELDAAVERRRRGSVAASDSGFASGCLFITKQVLLPTLANPVVFCVAMGLAVNLTGVALPKFVADSLDTVGASFSSISLFCLGMSMVTESSQADFSSPLGGELSTRMASGPKAFGKHVSESTSDPKGRVAVINNKANRENYGTGRWVLALLLIAAKSLLLPVLARFLVLEITGNDMFSRFAFIYSTIPPSTQTYIFAVKFGLPKLHLDRISLATLLGTLLAAPIMFGAAELALIDVTMEEAEQGDVRAGDVLRVAERIGWGSLLCAAWVVAVAISMLWSCNGQYGPRWRRSHLVWSVFFLGVSQLAFGILATICGSLRDSFGQPAARQCTLGMEGMSTAGRVWGVVLLVSDIHRSNRKTDHEALRGSSSCCCSCLQASIWMCIRVTKHTVLWAAWILPSAWVGGLVVTGLWGRLDPSCWSCLHTKALTPDLRAYYVASSLLAMILATIAIAALVWEQRQLLRTRSNEDTAQNGSNGSRPSLRRPSLHTAVQDQSNSIASTQPECGAENLNTALLGNVDRTLANQDGSSSGDESMSQSLTLPLWSSLHLRVVGLSNLVGLLLQIGIGVGSVLPRGGTMLEIIALNDFALFSQGLASGVMLGWFAASPLVAAVIRVGNFLQQYWSSMMTSYQDPLFVASPSPHPEQKLSGSDGVNSGLPGEKSFTAESQPTA
eukprot:SAG31_NODE_2420_length_5727_cov_2.670576_4_plen_857_part_00